MKKNLVVLAIIAFICSSVLWLPKVTAAQQDDPEATISALETQVAELEVLLTPTTVVPANEGDSLSTLGLFGPGVDMLPGGPQGEVAVVLVGEYGTWLPVVIQNNTNESISRASVSAAAYSPSGELIGAGTSLEFFPNVIEPGDHAIGNVSFSFLELPTDVTFEFQIEYEPGDYETILHDLTVVSATHQGDRIVGEVENSTDEFIENNAQVTFACMDSSGKLLRVEFLYTSAGSIEPGETALFQIDNYYFPCDFFAVTASGYGPV